MAEVISATAWRGTSAWEVAPGRSGNPEGNSGVILRPLGPVAMATLIARRSQRESFDRLVQQHWGFAAPAAGRAHFGGRGDLVWSGPDQWLAIAGPARDARALAAILGGAAAVSAQGDGRALVEVDGPAARLALAKLVSIDLHPDAFAPGCAAVTAFAHLSVQIWQREGASALTLCAPRSVAGSVWAALLSAAAAYGCEAIRAR